MRSGAEREQNRTNLEKILSTNESRLSVGNGQSGDGLYLVICHDDQHRYNHNDYSVETRTPGLRGIPAGMTTISAPVRAFLSPSSGGR